MIICALLNNLPNIFLDDELLWVELTFWFVPTLIVIYREKSDILIEVSDKIMNYTATYQEVGFEEALRGTGVVQGVWVWNLY